MRSEKRRGAGPDQTFIERARRAQLIDAAIDAIAELGYHAASLARIAERAGVSKSAVLYHFANKDALIQAVVAEVFRVGAEATVPTVAAQPSARGKLRAFLETNLAFMGEHRRRLNAVIEVWSNLETPDDRSELAVGVTSTRVDMVEAILRLGQERGEFRSFAIRPVAVTIVQALDGAASEVERDSELDLAAYARELVDLFDRATRSDEA
jgi:AcrR family transcriptional regulator